MDAVVFNSSFRETGQKRNFIDAREYDFNKPAVLDVIFYVKQTHMSFTTSDVPPKKVEKTT